MSNCKKCKAVLEPGASFCTNCGIEVETESAPSSDHPYCSQCGNALNADDVFCTNCGVEISTSLKASTSPRRKKTMPRKTNRRKKAVNTRKKKSLFARQFTFLVWVALFFFVLILIPESWYESFGTEGTDPVASVIKSKEVDLKAVAKTIVPEPFELIKKTITESGAELSEGMVRISVPAGAVVDEKHIEIKKLLGTVPRGSSSNPNTLEAIPIGDAYDIGPDGISFEKPITFSLAYDPVLLPKEIGESNLVLVYFDGQKWVHLGALHDRVNHTFTASASEFSGSLIHIIGVPILIVGGGYMIVKGKHKKIYQMIWDPIRKNWMHTMIKPKNKTVKEYAKRLRIKNGGDLVSMDNLEEFDQQLQKLVKIQKTVPFGFVDKYNKKKFIELTKRYDPNAQFVKAPEEYIGKVDQSGKFGDCIDVTNVYVSMLRAKGIQAKGVAGYDVSGGPHAWTEVVIGTEVYAIDEYARLCLREDYVKCCVKYPPPGDTYRKMWDENGTTPYRSDWYKPTMAIIGPGGKIHAQDAKTYSFTAQTLGIPKDALYKWNFNNLGYSIASLSKTFNYKFRATGTYPLTCKVNWHGKELSRTINFTVHGTDEVVADKVYLTADRTTVAINETIRFDAKPVQKDYTYHWNFGDKTSENGKYSSSHVYKNNGTYTVVVEVRNEESTIVVGSDKLTVYVESPVTQEIKESFTESVSFSKKEYINPNFKKPYPRDEYGWYGGFQQMVFELGLSCNITATVKGENIEKAEKGPSSIIFYLETENPPIELFINANAGIQSGNADAEKIYNCYYTHHSYIAGYEINVQGNVHHANSGTFMLNNGHSTAHVYAIIKTTGKAEFEAERNKNKYPNVIIDYDPNDERKILIGNIEVYGSSGSKPKYGSNPFGGG
jgi:PKD repeat protein